MKEIILPEEFSAVDFYGINDANLEVIRLNFPLLKIVARGHELKVIGEDNEILRFETLFNELLARYRDAGFLDPDYVAGLVKEGDSGIKSEDTQSVGDTIVHGQNGIIVKARTPGQRRMVKSSRSNDVVFAIGPAGTGKTYTAVALAVKALKSKEVRRIILTRPAVEAGESLGFLPGDLKEKIDPYLRPLYDALYDMIPGDKLKSFIENGIIEIAPLAFMRGRTLDNAFVILDEAQNTTRNQLKMFLTRMGPSAKFVLTGDITQIDLPKQMPSGLIHGIELLKEIPGIDFVFLSGSDVVRHKLVKEIINAYSSSQKDSPEN